jgi:hypothetical protein
MISGTIGPDLVSRAASGRGGGALLLRGVESELLAAVQATADNMYRYPDGAWVP